MTASAWRWQVVQPRFKVNTSIICDRIEGEAMKKLRGFAALNDQARREVSAKGGRAAHKLGTAHRFDSQEATAAARVTHDRRRERVEAEGYIEKSETATARIEGQNS